jgi:hypothetical protein
MGVSLVAQGPSKSIKREKVKRDHVVSLFVKLMESGYNGIDGFATCFGWDDYLSLLIQIFAAFPKGDLRLLVMRVINYHDKEFRPFLSKSLCLKFISFSEMVSYDVGRQICRLIVEYYGIGGDFEPAALNLVLQYISDGQVGRLCLRHLIGLLDSGKGVETEMAVVAALGDVEAELDDMVNAGHEDATKLMDLWQSKIEGLE